MQAPVPPLRMSTLVRGRSRITGVLWILRVAFSHSLTTPKRALRASSTIATLTTMRTMMTLKVRHSIFGGLCNNANLQHKHTVNDNVQM